MFMANSMTDTNSSIPGWIARLFRAGAACSALLGSDASGQDLALKARAQERPVLIRGATVHTVSGDTIENASVVFDRGVITSVGRGEPAEIVAQSPTIIEARGRHVYPGLFGANTVTGLSEVNAARATKDVNEVGEFTPEVRPAVAVNPDSAIIPVTRANGVLLTGIMPAGGLIPGRVSVIALDGWTWEDMTVLADAGMMVNWPSVRPVTAWWMSRSESEQLEDIRKSLKRIEDFFDSASAYTAAKNASGNQPVDLRFEAMGGVLSSAVPVFARADEFAQIESVCAFAQRRGLKLVIVGGRDAPLAAEAIKKAGAGVIVTGTFRMPRRGDSAYDEAFTLPARLESSGVEWCLATEGGEFQTPHERNLPYHAALAVAHGLDRSAAIRAITLAPARLLGVADRYGSIEKGKSATLIITDGDPLEMTTIIEHAFIDGREVDLTSKQTRLNEKYREKYRRLEGR